MILTDTEVIQAIELTKQIAVYIYPISFIFTLYFTLTKVFKLNVEFMFAWYDFWIGLFYDTKKKVLYFFPVPMFGVKVYKKYKTYKLEDWLVNPPENKKEGKLTAEGLQKAFKELYGEP